MLAGLPSDYRPMVMAIENSTKELSMDFVRNRLLQEVALNEDTGATALFAKKRNNFNKKKKKS